MLATMTFEDLRSIGLPFGSARRVKDAIDGVSAAGLGSLSLVADPPAASPVRSFFSSNFKAVHSAAKDEVKFQHELFASILAFLTGMCRLLGVPTAAAEDLFHRLQGESFENPQELLSKVQVAATRIWTSTQKLQGAGVDKAFNVEFCSLLNRALRDDDAQLMPHLVVIVRAINALCIARCDGQWFRFPPNAVSHRGGALPQQHHHFFTVGKKYRVPMYLATSFSEDKAYEFWWVCCQVFPPNTLLRLTSCGQVPAVFRRSSASALGHPLRPAGGALAALPLQEREPGGEDGQGRGGRAGVSIRPVRAL